MGRDMLCARALSRYDRQATRSSSSLSTCNRGEAVEKGRRRQWRKGGGGSGEREKEVVEKGRRRQCG
jgi:hypothetical protein